MKKLFTLFLCVLGLFFLKVANANTRHHTKSWNNLVVSGPLSADKKIRYFLQPGLNLIDNAYKFGNTFLFAGIGRVLNPDMTIWLMDGYSVSRNSAGKYFQRNTLRQQFDWITYRCHNQTLTSTTRLEERKQVSASPIAVRVRQRFWLRLPLQSAPQYYLSLFDEVFNINNPAWISTNSFFNENRLFIGFGKQITPAFAIDFGYMNQFLNHNISQVNNVIFLRAAAIFQ